MKILHQKVVKTKEEQIINYAKIIKKTSRERLKGELNNSEMQQAMSSLGNIYSFYKYNV